MRKDGERNKSANGKMRANQSNHSLVREMNPLFPTLLKKSQIFRVMSMWFHFISHLVLWFAIKQIFQGIQINWIFFFTHRVVELQYLG